MIDVGSMLAEKRRKRVAFEAVGRAYLERNVIVAMLMGGAWLDACAEVELDDFGDLRYRAIFCAIRELQRIGADVDPMIVADEIAREDVRLEKHVADTVNMAFVCALLCDAPRRESPTSACSQMDRDGLRDFAIRRRNV